jgi:anti-sigma regulatory factor (Ser/Thr protein kinase)
MKSIKVPGRYESLATIGDFVRQTALEAGFSGFDVYSIETAVDEACSNIIEHAYSGEGKGEIACTCSVDPQKGLTIALCDFGSPFSPAEIAIPDVDAPLEEREGHGLGLFFMRQLMDEVCFDFSKECGNTLTLIKHFPK